MRRNVIMLTVTVVVIVGWFVATLLSDNRPVLGLDLQGGTSIVLAPVKGSDPKAIDAALAIIRNRVDGLGIAEPDVSRQGNNIVVDLPGVKNAAQAQRLVGKTAELRFREVLGALPYSTENALPTSTSSTTKKGATTTTIKGATTTVGGATSTTLNGKSLGPPVRSIDAQPIAVRRPAQATASSTVASTAAPATTTPTTTKGSTTPTTVPEAARSCQNGKLVTKNATDRKFREQQVVLPDRDKKECLLLDKSLLLGTAVGSADAYLNPNNGKWQVNLHFKNDDFINKIAKPMVGKQVAIELDGIVQSAPQINQGITGRDVEITSPQGFPESDANDLALSLKYGALPIQLVPQTAQNVSPSLGRDQLHAGIVAGIVGLALVALYMVAFYRLLGLVVWVGLGLTGMVFFSLVTWLSTNQGLTLTLAGVTGIIVSVGVTVDSYVVYFERLKDEVRTGKTIRSSLDSGFRRAFRTIIAADLVSLIGAAVLYLLAVGSVRGFAFFLGLSTLLDLVIAYFFMHPCVYLMSRRPSLVRMRGIGIAAGLDVPEVRA